MRVAVLRGGPSEEYLTSLATGGEVLGALPKNFEGEDILLTKTGEWYTRGLPFEPSNLAAQTDVVFNALHGSYGEDGQLARVLELWGVPYTGSGPAALATGLNKRLAKERVRLTGLLVPQDCLTAAGPREIFNAFSPPWLIKPLTGGSGLGLELITSYPQLVAHLANLDRDQASKNLVEEYIRGREVSCAVVENFRGQSLYAFPPVEIRRPAGSLFDYEAKYGERFDERYRLCPAWLTESEKGLVQEAARLVHQTLGLRHYSMSDFILSPRGLYFLEVNALPSLTKRSLLPQSLRAVGGSLSQFVNHILNLATR